VLMEGSPGVGKTSLVHALAKAAGYSLTRINLSDQTVHDLSINDALKLTNCYYFRMPLIYLEQICQSRVALADSLLGEMDHFCKLSKLETGLCLTRFVLLF
jgi:replication-associated recombination protein RarA